MLGGDADLFLALRGDLGLSLLDLSLRLALQGEVDLARGASLTLALALLRLGEAAGTDCWFCMRVTLNLCASLA